MLIEQRYPFMTPEPSEPEFLRLLFTDILGSVRSIELGYDRLDEVMKSGVFIDGSSVPGYAPINDSDALLLPYSAAPLPQPWDPLAALLLCRVHEATGAPHPGEPHSILERMVRRASEEGFKLLVGCELEFFVLTKSSDGTIAPCDQGGYFSSQPRDSALELRRDIIRSLNTIGIRTTSHHHEVANGQQEIGLLHMPAEIAADSIMLARLVISQMAYRRGLIATFMPKPFADKNGSGMHLHQSIWDSDSKKNLFASEKDSQISTLAQHYVGGLLEHAIALAGVVAPTVNSYKRLVPGFEAPAGIAWGYRNRSTMIRVPHFNGSQNASRIELRCPDSSTSPHLVIAAMLAAGLDGVRRHLEPPPPIGDNLYETDIPVKSLPGSLHEVVSCLGTSDFMREALGDSTIDYLVMKREEEWKDYASITGVSASSEITDWEIERYLLSN
jgi:glutamine synthetase